MTSAPTVAKYARQMPGLASLVLVIALGAVLAELTWRLVPAPDGDVLAPATAETSGSAPTAKGGNTRPPGLDVPLFGELPKVTATPVQPTKQEAAPVTTLALKLRGVAAADVAAEALAIIEGPDGKSLPYRIGDTLPGDAELRAVHVDRVVLVRGGREEVLPFSDEKPTGSSTANRQTPRPTVTAGTGSSRQLAPATSAKLREYLSILPNQPARMTELVRALPVMENGQLTGFRLFPGRQRNLFSEVGLRRGDIVTRVNGMPVNDPVQSSQLLSQLASATQVQIEIIRRGKAQVLNVQL